MENLLHFQFLIGVVFELMKYGTRCLDPYDPDLEKYYDPDSTKYCDPYSTKYGEGKNFLNLSSSSSHAALHGLVAGAVSLRANLYSSRFAQFM